MERLMSVQPSEIECEICDARPGQECERFDPISRCMMPLGHPHLARQVAAREATEPCRLFPIDQIPTKENNQ